MKNTFCARHPDTTTLCARALSDGRLITFINFLSLHHKHFSPPLAGDLFLHLENLISKIDFFFLSIFRTRSLASCAVSVSDSAPKNFRSDKRIFPHPRIFTFSSYRDFLISENFPRDDFSPDEICLAV